LLGFLKALQAICCRIAIACSQVLIGHVRTQSTHSGCPFIPGLPQEVLALPGPSCTMCPKDISQDVHSAGNPQIPSPCCPKCPWDILADTTRMSITRMSIQQATLRSLVHFVLSVPGTTWQTLPGCPLPGCPFSRQPSVP